MSFAIHPQLLSDCHLLGKTSAGWLLLSQNALIPWLILVPETELGEFLDLPADQREHVMQVSHKLSQFIRSYWQLSKINFAALGNVVPQIHIHLIGRKPGDACWPKPIWGHLTDSKAYSAEEIDRISQAILSVLPDLTAATSKNGG